MYLFSTIFQDYRNVDQVHIRSNARVELDPALNIQQISTENDYGSVRIGIDYCYTIAYT